MNSMRKISLGLAVLGLVNVHGVALCAQTGTDPASLAVQGKIVSIKGSQVAVGTASGDVPVRLVESTRVLAETPIKISDIKAGLYVGATAQKQADGSFLASAVHVFSDDERGQSEGHRPSSSTPNSTMTNANVDRVEDVVVRDVQGRMLTLKYKGGEIKVLVPPTASIVKRLPGEAGMLKTGATVRVVGTKSADGAISASSITIRAAQK